MISRPAGRVPQISQSMTFHKVTAWMCGMKSMVADRVPLMLIQRMGTFGQVSLGMMKLAADLVVRSCRITEILPRHVIHMYKMILCFAIWRVHAVRVRIGRALQSEDTIATVARRTLSHRRCVGSSTVRCRTALTNLSCDRPVVLLASGRVNEVRNGGSQLQDVLCKTFTTRSEV